MYLIWSEMEDGVILPEVDFINLMPPAEWKIMEWCDAQITPYWDLIVSSISSNFFSSCVNVSFISIPFDTFPENCHI